MLLTLSSREDRQQLNKDGNTLRTVYNSGNCVKRIAMRRYVEATYRKLRHKNKNKLNLGSETISTPSHKMMKTTSNITHNRYNGIAGNVLLLDSLCN